LNDINVRHGDVEFVRDDLSKAGADAGAESTFPVNRNNPLFIDGEKRIDIIERHALWC
jgi:hypothetical protein